LSEATASRCWGRAIEWDCTRLVHHYANLNDAAEWEAAANLFTEDGRLFRPTAPDQPIVGRDAILAAFLARSPRATRHVCANVVVQVLSADSAIGESAMLLFTGSGAPLDPSRTGSSARKTDGVFRSAKARSSFRREAIRFHS